MTETISGTGRTRTEDDRGFFDWRYVRGLKERRRHYRLAFILEGKIAADKLFPFR
jgi:hypothetical protein